MLRAVLLASPLLLALASCGDSTSSFDDSALAGGTKAMGASAGEGSGATANNGGDGTASGTASTGGSSSSTGGKGQGGGSAGAKNNGGAGTHSGGTSAGGNGGAQGGSASEGGTNQSGSGGASQAGSGGAQAGSGGSDVAGGGSGGSTAGSANGGMGGSGGGAGPTCPDLIGDYIIKNLEGGGCFGVDDKSSQSIESTDTACTVHFVSALPQFSSPQSGPGVNGTAMLGTNGDFGPTTLMVGKLQRLGCTGAWDANSDRMTVKCGAGPQGCSITLERK